MFAKSIVHLWKSDSVERGAGTAVAMYRVHEALLDKGVNSHILCNNKFSDAEEVTELPKKNPIIKVVEKILRAVFRAAGFNDLYVITGGRIRRHPKYQQSDIVTLHGTHHGFINYLTLPRLLKGKKTVFVLHDMWAVSGHCAFHYDCEKWKTGCGKCPYPDNVPKIKRDATKWEWKLKKWVFSKLDITLISPSKAVKEVISQSFLNHLPIYHVPHGINERIYIPHDKFEARKALNLPENKKLIFISAVDLNDLRKGGDLLEAALKQLPETLKQNCAIMTMGIKKEELGALLEMEVYQLGFIKDEATKALAYSAADIFVHPSRAESFGLVILEAMACGTPAIGLSTAGVGDLIRPGKTGLLANGENSADLSRCMRSLLTDDAMLEQLSTTCRDVVLKEYTLEKQAQRYLAIYSDL